MKPKVLIQLDPDLHPSTFDSIVAIDSGIDQLLAHHAVTPSDITPLVHGAMFTRGPEDLRYTALFIGGSNVQAAERLQSAAQRCFFGPMRVSLMSDPNGSNTTAAAAVLSAQRHVNLGQARVVVLAGTGPVGQRIVRLVADAAGAQREIVVCSRRISKARSTCEELRETLESDVELVPAEAATVDEAAQVIEGAEVVFAAGAAGIPLLDERWQQQDSLKVMVDLNAVPPAGIESIAVTDRAVERAGVHCYGAIGVGQLKMKIHKASIAALFESNDQVLDTQEIYHMGQKLVTEA